MTLAISVSDLDAEKSVLGSALLDPQALAETVGRLKAHDFADTYHRAIFGVMKEMYSNNIPVDYLTLSERLESKNILDRLGGTRILSNLAASVSSTANVKYYIDIIRDRSLRRQLIDTGNTIIQLASELDKAVPDVLDKADKLLLDAGQNRNAGEFLPVKECLIASVNHLRETLGRKPGSLRSDNYSTGLIDLDNATGGLTPGSFNILAARPSMGKTALALNIAQFGGSGDNRDNTPVLIFSLEMPKEQIINRMISAQSGVNLSKIMNGTLSTIDFQAIKQACDILCKREIYISDATQLSALDVRSLCRRFKMRYPALSLVVIDYLQLMTSGDTRTNINRQQEVADISRVLKSVAREINCPVLALSQLSRAAEQRTDKKPQLADLRDSGAIEQDADLVMMLFRSDYYGDNERNELADSEAELRVAKNRNGSTGTVKLIFKRENTLFCNRAQD